MRFEIGNELPFNWSFLSIDEVCSKVTSGGTPSRRNSTFYENGTICWVKTKELADSFIKCTEEQITNKAIKQSSAKLLPPNTVLMAMYGATVGMLGILETEMACNQACCAMIFDTSIADPRYSFYLLVSQRKKIQSLATGAAQQNLSANQIKQFEFPFPPLEEQKKIANILGELDNKIQNNYQINQTLEQMAQVIFKSWFVDFEPVKAKIAVLEAGGSEEEALLAAMQAISGKDVAALARLQTEHPEQYNELRTTAELFPSAMQDSELGEIPMAWHQPVIYDLANYINGAAYKKFEPNNLGNGLPIVKIAELKAGITERTGFSTVDMPEKYKLRDRDILFSWSGNPDTSIDTFVWSHGEAWLNQHIFKVVPKSTLSRDYILCLLRHLKPVFADIARDKQTTGLGHVTVQDLKKLFVVMPNENILNRFNEIVQPLLALNFCLVKQIRHLEQIRDSVLPKLLSGELTVDYLNELSLEAVNV